MPPFHVYNKQGINNSQDFLAFIIRYFLERLCDIIFSTTCRPIVVFTTHVSVFFFGLGGIILEILS